MQLFYAPNIFDQVHFLPEDESKHLIRVLRKQLGDQIYLTDGRGHLYEGKIANDHAKKCALEIVKKEKHANPLTREIHIAIAPTKNNDRMEWFVEKAVEIGVSSITPIICENSERVKLKQERILKVAISAMKQSNRLYLPLINESMKFADFLTKDNAESKLIAHCEEDEKLEIGQLSVGKSVSILIGPEGDFSPREIEKALEGNYIPTSLGNSRLRTETAGIVACTLLNQ